MMKAMSFAGKGIIKSVDKMTMDPMKYQQELLFSLLEENKDTGYGKAHGFANIHTIEDYRKRVPLGEYDDFAP